jgi:hypothetical protein
MAPQQRTATHAPVQLDYSENERDFTRGLVARGDGSRHRFSTLFVVFVDAHVPYVIGRIAVHFSGEATTQPFNRSRTNVPQGRARRAPTGEMRC